MTDTTIRTLAQLLHLLNWAPLDKGPDQVAYAESYGLPTAHGEIDLTSLPTFGGEAPADAAGVWSWDETFLLIGECASDLRMVTRAEYEYERTGNDGWTRQQEGR